MGILKNIVTKRQNGQTVGIPSYCTANEVTIGALMRAYRDNKKPLLIESTANQVDQFGGYTGMKPTDFRDMVYRLATENGIERERIILGGDHLGPLTFKDRSEHEAMALAIDLVKAYVLAGYKKIHLDTSMRLGDDDPNAALPVETVARRGALLFDACIEALQTKDVARAEWPEFVIGSEVPVPGGAAEALEIDVTSPADYEETVRLYKEAFSEKNLSEHFDLITAVVVQPGVEYGDHDVAVYDREAAKALMDALQKTPDLMFEGHSTDYQPLSAMRAMVEDGVGILKVGPMITNAYREGLYALAEIEKWLLPTARQSHLIDVVERVMTDDPKYWQAYYQGDESALKIARHFSLSDRIRYYLPYPEIDQAIKKMIANFEGIEIPTPLLSQYAPSALGAKKASQVTDAFVSEVVELYEAAVS